LIDFRGAEEDPSADIGERTPDIDPVPGKVDVTDPESSSFAQRKSV
jgi:hypothetical protein